MPNVATMPGATARTAIHRLARNGQGLKLAIPRRFAHALGWPLGCFIYMQLNPDDSITLMRVAPPKIDNVRTATPP